VGVHTQGQVYGLGIKDQKFKYELEKRGRRTELRLKCSSSLDYYYNNIALYPHHITFISIIFQNVIHEQHHYGIIFFLHTICYITLVYE